MAGSSPPTPPYLEYSLNILDPVLHVEHVTTGDLRATPFPLVLAHCVESFAFLVRAQQLLHTF